MDKIPNEKDVLEEATKKLIPIAKRQEMYDKYFGPKRQKEKNLLKIEEYFKKKISEDIKNKLGLEDKSLDKIQKILFAISKLNSSNIAMLDSQFSEKNECEIQTEENDYSLLIQKVSLLEKEKEKLLNEMDNITTEKNKIQEEIDKLNNEGNKEGNEQEIKRLEKQIAELSNHHIVLSNKLKEQRENLENKQKELDQVKEDKKRLEQEKNDAIEEKERFKVSYDNIFEEKKKIEEEIEKLRQTNFTTTGNERYEENNRQEDEQKLQKLEKQEKELNRRLEILQELVKKKLILKFVLK